MAGTHISETGLKKRKLNAVIDRESWDLIIRNYISSIKLAAVDKAKLFAALLTLDPIPALAQSPKSPGSEVSSFSRDSTDIPSLASLLGAPKSSAAISKDPADSNVQVTMAVVDPA
jgi:hypothetical protein